MMKERTPLTLALANFDRHLPFFMGVTPEAEGYYLKALDVGMSPPGRDGGNRHSRMLRDEEFDVAELSLASYILAKFRGAPFTAVPVFPRRLFSANHIYVSARSGIKTPQDLRGRRVAIRGWQVSLSVLAKGDLKTRHGVDWRDIEWFVQDAEEIAFSDPRIRLHPLKAGATAAELLIAGEIDALIDPKPPASVLDGNGGVHNLFADPRAECLGYFQARQCFPAVHVLAIRQKTADRYPSLPNHLITAWEDAQRQTRQAYDDYAYTSMPLGRLAWEQSRRDFGDNLFPAGLKANRENLRWFIDYLADQALLPEAVTPESLFHPSVLNT